MRGCSHHCHVTQAAGRHVPPRQSVKHEALGRQARAAGGTWPGTRGRRARPPAARAARRPAAARAPAARPPAPPPGPGRPRPAAPRPPGTRAPHPRRPGPRPRRPPGPRAPAPAIPVPQAAPSALSVPDKLPEPCTERSHCLPARVCWKSGALKPSRQGRAARLQALLRLRHGGAAGAAPRGGGQEQAGGRVQRARQVPAHRAPAACAARGGAHALDALEQARAAAVRAAHRHLRPRRAARALARPARARCVSARAQHQARRRRAGTHGFQPAVAQDLSQKSPTLATAHAGAQTACSCVPPTGT